MFEMGTLSGCQTDAPHRRGAHDSTSMPLRRIGTDNHRFAAQIGRVMLLYRRKKGVHIHVYNYPVHWRKKSPLTIQIYSRNVIVNKKGKRCSFSYCKVQS